MHLPRAYSSSMSVSTFSKNWRTLIKQNHLVSQISSILLQRHNWVSLLQSFNLSSALTPSLFLQILQRIQTHPQISINFFNWVESNLKFQPDLKSQCHIIQLSLGSGFIQPIRPILDSLVQTHPVSVLGDTMIRACRGKDSQSNVLSFVLECYSHKGLFMDGLEVFRKMRINGCRPSVQACNALLDVLLRENEIKLAWSFYGNMTRGGVLPNKLTWSLLAQILSKDGKYERIVKFVNMGIYNSVMYNAVIDCHCKNRNFGAAFDCLNEMCDRKLHPGFSTYSSILDGACRHNSVEVIEKVTAMMVEKGLLQECSLSESDSIIQKLCDLGKMNAAMMYYRRACNEKIGLEDVTYRCLLKALSKEGRVGEVIDLYHLITERGIAMKDRTYHAFVDLLCKEYQFEEGFEILKDVVRKGFIPRNSALSALISSLSDEGRTEVAEQLLNVLLEQGLLPDSSCCCSLVNHYYSNRQINKAVELHDKMEGLQASLDLTTYNILINGLAKERRVEEAIRVFDYMKRLNLASSSSFTVVIRMLCHAKKMRQAMKLHDEMLNMGLKPDKSTYKKLILEFKQ